MVTTRKTKPPGEKDVQLKDTASGSLEVEPQREPKRAKASPPLQEADKEIEEAIEKTHAKEKERLLEAEGEGLEEQLDKEVAMEQERTAGEDCKPGGEAEAQKEEAEAAREVEKEGMVPEQQAITEKGEAEGEEAVEGEEEEIVGGEGAEEVEGVGAASVKKKTGAAMAKGQGEGGKGTSSLEEEIASKYKPLPNLKPGDPAPDFTLPDENGKMYSLHDFRGKFVVLYFYGTDRDKVVHKGASQGFAKAIPEMQALGAEVLFIAPGTPESHKKLKEQTGLQCPILIDEDKKVNKMYHTVRGRGIKRSTVVVDKEGKIIAVMGEIPAEEADKNPFEALELLKTKVGTATA